MLCWYLNLCCTKDRSIQAAAGCLNTATQFSLVSVTAGPTSLKAWETPVTFQVDSKGTNHSSESNSASGLT